MRARLPVGVITPVAVAFALTATFSAQSPGNVDFGRDVQPIFRQRCVGCHGPTQQMNGLRLDRRRDAMRGGTIAVIGPGHSEASRLYLRLVGNQYGSQMPPTGPLAASEVATIKAWIDQGAEWPDALSGETPAPPPDPAATRLIDALRAGERATFVRVATATSKAGNLTGEGGSTPLMFAALAGDAAAVQLLLDQGADPNISNGAGATALMWAVSDLATSTLLVNRGANVNARSADGRTPLMIAAGRHGAAPVVKLLLEHGADPSTKGPGLAGLFELTPITAAAEMGDETVLKLLIDAGAKGSEAGPAALALALRAQCLACVDMLIKVMPREYVTGAMMIASPPFGPSLATPMLLAKGADARAVDPAGHTALMLAASSDAIPVDAVKALIEHGADVNATAANGVTALRLARQRGHTPVVDLLMKAGAKDDLQAPVDVPKPLPAATVRAAVERTLPLLQQNDVAFMKKSGCVSCHNNTVTAMVTAVARAQGFSVNEQIARDQVKKVAAYLADWRERVLQNIGIPGDADTISYILVGLAAQNYPPDAATDAMARFLKAKQVANGQWRGLAHRPPIESSDIQVTAMSMRSLQVYTPKAHLADYRAAINRAAAWLKQAIPSSMEDRTFQLLAFSWLGADQRAIDHAAKALVAEQRADGGWAQIPTLESDAYATGQALVALKQSRARGVDRAVQRGVRYLLQTQLADGSWHVRARALPIQPHFESGFPHGRSQFISAAATNWAAMGLITAMRPPRS